MLETKSIMGLLRGFAGGARGGRPPVTQRDPAALEDLIERNLLLNGRLAARLQPRNTPVKDLAEVEFRVFSQWGEDGIIEWLVSHVAVPNCRFVEFGVESFSEANCRFLMFNRNWKGLVIDSNADYMAGLQSDHKLWTHDLTALHAFVTAENINQLISGAGFSGPLGILSIDVDGNDYWVWQAIDCVSPAIVICEYNSLFGDLRPLVIPYDPEFERFKAHPSGLYFGASIGALQRIAVTKGYSFIGTNSNGNNAFFVRDDLAHFVLPLIGKPKASPSRHRGGRDGQGRLTFTPGLARLGRIKECKVLDVETGQMLRLSDINPLYSGDWTAGMS